MNSAMVQPKKTHSTQTQMQLLYTNANAAGLFFKLKIIIIKK